MPDAPANDSGETLDSFVYAVTDGIHTVNASVFIRIIDANEAPKQLRQIPDVVFYAADGDDESHVRIMDLTQYFIDDDGDNLSYESDDFESTFGFTLSPAGVLTADASILDVNQWRATVSVSDGIESVESTFVITVRVPNSLKSTAGNEDPEAADIRNSSFTDEFSYDVSQYFSDDDLDDQLTYTAVGLPTDVQIRADGVIEGTVSAANTGRFFIQVTAEDGYGGNVTDGFNLTLN